jgi:Zn-dependent protease with chaperone function
MTNDAQSHTPENQSAELKRSLWKLTLVSALFLGGIPAFTLWFSLYGEAHFARELAAQLSVQLEEMIAQAPPEAADSAAAARAALRDLSIERLCAGEFPTLLIVRDQLCGTTQTFGQFELARKLALWTLGLGALTMLLLGYFALRLYQREDHQYGFFNAGWQMVRIVGAIIVVVQGAMLTWLSYWLTAYFFNFYAIKLVLIAGVLALAGVGAVLRAIFKRTESVGSAHGVVLNAERAPALWRRLNALAERVGTAPPKQVIAGIDDNFYVTETPVVVGQADTEPEHVSGRSLFVSLPLLGAMNWDESDAVLAHELAHFKGGDTAFSSKLGPKLAAFHHYLDEMHGQLITLVVAYPLSWFRALCEFGLSKHSRTREFAADKLAAEVAGSGAIARALVKIAGFASFRGQLQQTLFDAHDRHQGALDIADRVRSGMHAFTQSADFSSVMDHGAVPHPFDSHPPMAQRMQHVGAVIAPSDYARVVLKAPDHSWLKLIPDAAAIEKSLWQQYEQHFSDSHEKMLAERYLPSTEAEREVVLKHFPDLEILCQKNGPIALGHKGFKTAKGAVQWSNVTSIAFKDRSLLGTDAITFTLSETNAVGMRKSVTLKYRVEKQDRDPVQALITRYWQRHLSALAASETSPTS